MKQIARRIMDHEQNLRDIREASGRHPGYIWEASGCIQEASGTPGSHGAPGGSKSQKSMPLSAKMQKHSEFLCRPILGIVEEKSTTRNDEGGVIVRGIIEKESLRRHSGGAIIEGGASGNPLGALWEASVWESFGSHLGVIWRAWGWGGIWETFGGQISEIDAPLS
jgi:hypothetical protein